jgi:hypothetical protein
VPVLLAKAKGKKGDHGYQMLGLHPPQGQGVDITLDTKLLHIFMRLLREQVSKTDWDVNLALYEGANATETVQDALPRKLN